MLIDTVENIDVPEGQYHNARVALDTLKVGLHLLYANVRKIEEQTLPDPTKLHFVSLIRQTNISVQDNYMLNCFFHWYSVSLVSYVRLVGLLKSKISPNSDPKYKYEDDVLPKEILLFRAKVGAHFVAAETNARSMKMDTNAERNFSVMPQISAIDGRFCAGGMDYTEVVKGVPETVSLGTWSLTRVHESLNSRFMFFEEKPVQPAQT